jgi:hypothetical protein
LPGESIDAVVTDPPYGIGFQGHGWDRPGTPATRRGPRTEIAGDAPADHLRGYAGWCAAWAAECLRVLKPGGHLVSFGAPRTSHHLASGIEAAGFELRDTLIWLFGQGFPKSRNLTGDWAGWGTTLKPAFEPIILARKPLALPTQRNAEQHGTGALHIDACRDSEGRWPPNLFLSHDPICEPERCAPECPIGGLGDRARFFYCAKAGRSERDAGCERLERRVIDTFKIGQSNEDRAAAGPVGNFHPTVKPLGLMRWLIRLTSTDGALVFDPFCGSGSTGYAAVLAHRSFLGIEQDAGYLQIGRPH